MLTGSDNVGIANGLHLEDIASFNKIVEVGEQEVQHVVYLQSITNVIVVAAAAAAAAVREERIR